MSERPLERLRYVECERLATEDLRLEQEFHVRLQRWLSRSLFTPGVADGLDVLPVDGGARVVVTPGVALDDQGRAIILVHPVELIPLADHLCVRYRERQDGPDEGGCAVRTASGAIDARWEGRRRIVSEPDFTWRRELPLGEARELVIATLIRSPAGVVEAVESGPPLAAAPRPLAQVRPMSLEGEKDLDQRNPLVVTFHVARRKPTAVTLHVSALDFSTLHYSELGSITPRLTGTGADGAFQTTIADRVDPHSHVAGLITEPEDPAHSHTLSSRVFAPTLTVGGDGDKGIFIAPEGATVIGGGVRPIPAPPFALPFGAALTVTSLGAPVDLTTVGTGFSVTGGRHAHDVSGKTSDAVTDTQRLHTHRIPVTVTTSGSAGPTPVRGGTQRATFTGLEITVDGVPCTAHVLAQAAALNPTAWSSITSLDGGLGHPLRGGTGPIRLDRIPGLSFDADEDRPHTITFSVRGAGNGGRVQFNLYVE